MTRSLQSSGRLTTSSLIRPGWAHDRRPDPGGMSIGLLIIILKRMTWKEWLEWLKSTRVDGNEIDWPTFWTPELWLDWEWARTKKIFRSRNPMNLERENCSNGEPSLCFAEEKVLWKLVASVCNFNKTHWNFNMDRLIWLYSKCRFKVYFTNSDLHIRNSFRWLKVRIYHRSKHETAHSAVFNWLIAIITINRLSWNRHFR